MYSCNFTPRKYSPGQLKELMQDIEKLDARLERLHEENILMGIKNEDANEEFKRLRLRILDLLDIHQFYMGELETNEQKIRALTDRQMVSVMQKTVRLLEDKLNSGEIKEFQLREVKTILDKYE